MKLFGKPVGLIVLDFDGVVLDLMARYWLILAATARAMHLSVGPIERYREGHYNGTRKGSARFSAVVRECWPHLSEAEAMAYYWRFRAEEERIGYPLVPGSVETIRWFRKRGVPVAICAMNDERAMKWKLAAARIGRDTVDLVITRESAGYEKPDPRILKPAFRCFAVPAAAAGMSVTGTLISGLRGTPALNSSPCSQVAFRATPSFEKAYPRIISSNAWPTCPSSSPSSPASRGARGFSLRKIYAKRGYFWCEITARMI